MEYNEAPLELRETAVFMAWIESLRDRRARGRVKQRLRRLSLGLAGDARPVGRGVTELRIDYGPGYRVYCKRVRPDLIVILAGGDKDSQSRDIPLAIELADCLEIPE